MLSNDKLRLGLVHHFLKVEGYKSSKFDSSNESFLLHSKNKFRIIWITMGDYDINNAKLAELKEGLKDSKREKLEILHIAICDSPGDTNESINSIFITNNDLFKDGIVELFPKIINLKLKEDEAVEEVELSEEEIIEGLQDPKNSKDKEFQKLNYKLTNKIPVFSFIYFVLFILGPIATYIWSFYLVSKGNSMLSIPTINALVFGGVDHNLTVLGGQWWRILTYGFTSGAPLNIIYGFLQLVVLNYIIFKLLRYTEVVVGSIKLAVSVLISYILVGFVVSSTMLTGVYTGQFPLFAAVLGAVTTSLIGTKNTVTVVTKTKIIIPVIVLILFPMFTGQISALLLEFIAFSSSVSILYMVNYNYKKADWFISIPVIMLSALIIAPVVLLFIPTYTPARDSYTIYSLLTYWVMGFDDVNQINDMFHKIGWNDIAAIEKVINGVKNLEIIDYM